MRADAIRDVVLDDACRATGLDPTGARLLRSHATAVYLLPGSGIVARISPRGGSVAPIRRAVQVTSWLVENGFPAVAPAPVPGQPVEVGGHVISFWEHLPQPPGFVPDVAALGTLLRRLHQLPPPPVELSRYRPLERLRVMLEQTGALPQTDRAWLSGETTRLLDAYETLDSPLGHGHVHGDAYPGNLLLSTGGPVLADWDETATGPREIDLANTYQGARFGRTDAELDRFARAYAHDLRRWPGLATLTAIRDVHTLGSYIRRAEAGDGPAVAELARRVHALRHGDRTARWAAS